MVAITVAFLTPVFIMLITSLKAPSDVSSPLALPQSWEWGNYGAALEQGGYVRALLNTVFLTGTSAVLTVVLGSLAAYPLARIGRRWTRATYSFFVLGLTVPVFALITPLYLLLRQLHLLNTFPGVILIYAALNLPLAVFFYTGFLRGISTEVEEAAVIDGANVWTLFWRIVFPLLRPTTATLAIFVSLNIWNDLVVPLVFLTGEDQRTVIVAAYSYVGAYGFSPSELFPAVVLATAPLVVVFLVLQRRIVAGIASGAVKG